MSSRLRFQVLVMKPFFLCHRYTIDAKGYYLLSFLIYGVLTQLIETFLKFGGLFQADEELFKFCISKSGLTKNSKKNQIQTNPW